LIRKVLKGGWVHGYKNTEFLQQVLSRPLAKICLKAPIPLTGEL
jgi:hypothetical protein